MSQELYYTSAPQGLKPGSRDYCTVARTPGLSAALADQLEGLSGYRILFMPQDPQAGRNPVAWSHVRLPSGSRHVSVLSRICASGLDYTGRTNKFAHHVALDDAERPAGGPAWLLSQPGFMVDKWNGHVGPLTSRGVPTGDYVPRIADAWHSAAGDAGWAGVVAESFLADPRRLVYLIFEPGMDVLPLFAEAQALLPPEQRWEVGFNTFYTNLPPGIACPWRGIVADSPEADEARRLPQALILDLTRKQGLGPARGGVLVEQAKTGERPPARTGPPPLPQPSRPPTPAVPQLAPELNPAPLRSFAEPVEKYRSAPPPVGYDLVIPAKPPALPPPIRRRGPERRPSMLPTILASAGVSLLIVVGGIVFWANFQKGPDEPSTGPGLTNVASNDQPSGPLPAAEGSGAGGTKKEGGTDNEDEKGKKEKPKSSADDSPDHKEPDLPFWAVPGHPHYLQPRDPRALEHLKKLARKHHQEKKAREKMERDKLVKKNEKTDPQIRFVTLPEVPSDSDGKVQEPISLKLDLPEETECTLDILGLTEAPIPEASVEKAGDDARSIRIVTKNLAGDPTEIAGFQIKDRQVQFHWGRVADAKRYGNALSECALVVRHGKDDLRHVLLREPAKADTNPLKPETSDLRKIDWGPAGKPMRGVKIGACRLVLKDKQTALPKLPTKWEPISQQLELKPRVEKVRAVTIKVEMIKPNPPKKGSDKEPEPKAEDEADKPTRVKASFEPARKWYKDRFEASQREIGQCDAEIVVRTAEIANHDLDKDYRTQAAVIKKKAEEAKKSHEAERAVLKSAMDLIDEIGKRYELIVPLVITVGGKDFEIARIGRPDTSTSKTTNGAAAK